MKFETVAIFFEPTQAHISRNLLAGEGITSFLRNETIVSTDWSLGGAVGNIQLQVADKDYETALHVLEATTDITESELTELALGSSDEKFSNLENTEESSREGSAYDEQSDDLTDEPNAREYLVERAFRASILFLYLWVFSPLLTWMLITISTIKEPIRPRYKFKLWFAMALHIPILCCLALVCVGMLRTFFVLVLRRYS